VVTVHFLQDASIGMLSILSFQAYGDSVADLSNVVAKFLQRSKEAELKKILFDVQQNFGGNTLLAFEILKQVGSDKDCGAILDC
jgi:C-terminal processing protease CtpA/Prc